MRKCLFQIVCILLVGAGIGLLANALSPAGISLTRNDPFVTAEKAAKEEKIPTLDLSAARKVFEDGSVVFVDAREPEVFAKGRIRGALNLPSKGFDATFPEFTRLIPPVQPVVVYCDGNDCHASNEVAGKLRGKGYKDVKIYFGGWQLWLDQQLPIEWN